MTILILIFFFVVVCWIRGGQKAKREQALLEQARREQEWREQTIANGILRANAQLAEARQRALDADPAQQRVELETRVANGRRSYYAEMIAKRQQDGANDFNRLLDK